MDEISKNMAARSVRPQAEWVASSWAAGTRLAPRAVVNKTMSSEDPRALRVPVRNQRDSAPRSPADGNARIRACALRTAAQKPPGCPRLLAATPWREVGRAGRRGLLSLLSRDELAGERGGGMVLGPGMEVPGAFNDPGAWSALRVG